MRKRGEDGFYRAIRYRISGSRRTRKPRSKGEIEWRSTDKMLSIWAQPTPFRLNRSYQPSMLWVTRHRLNSPTPKARPHQTHQRGQAAPRRNTASSLRGQTRGRTGLEPKPARSAPPSSFQTLNILMNPKKSADDELGLDTTGASSGWTNGSSGVITAHPLLPQIRRPPSPSKEAGGLSSSLTPIRCRRRLRMNIEIGSGPSTGTNLLEQIAYPHTGPRRGLLPRRDL